MVTTSLTRIATTNPIVSEAAGSAINVSPGVNSKQKSTARSIVKLWTYTKHLLERHLLC